MAGTDCCKQQQDQDDSPVDVQRNKAWCRATRCCVFLRAHSDFTTSFFVGLMPHDLDPPPIWPEGVGLLPWVFCCHRERNKCARGFTTATESQQLNVVVACVQANYSCLIVTLLNAVCCTMANCTALNTSLSRLCCVCCQRLLQTGSPIM